MLGPHHRLRRTGDEDVGGRGGGQCAGLPRRASRERCQGPIAVCGGGAGRTLATPSSVRGGKYSKEMNGWSVAAVHALTMSISLEWKGASATCDG